MSKQFRLALAFLLALSLAVPSMAVAMPAKKSAISPKFNAAISPKLASLGVRALVEPDNNDFTGAEALPAGPSVFNLDSVTDPWDTYYVDLVAGDKISVKVNAAASTDFDVFIYAPDASEVASPAVFGSMNLIYPEAFTYVPATPGRYYVAVQAVPVTLPDTNAGSYTLTSKIEAAEADDDIPGVTLPASSPVTGTLDRYGDQDDVYKVLLDQGETFKFSMTGPTNADFDAFIFGPDATSVYASDPQLSSDGLTSSESGLFTAPLAGLYYLDIYAAYGAGSYTVTHDAGKLSILSLTGPATVRYGGTAKFSGSLVETPPAAALEGQVVTLQRKPYGASSWSSVATASVDASGNYTFSAKPSVATYYRTYFVNDALEYLPVYSTSVLVKPGVSITVPSAPSIVRRGAVFTSGGYLKPRHTAGAHNVRIYAQRYERQSNGTYKWVTRRTFSTTNSNYGSYSRYSARVSLPSAGRWRFQSIYTTTSKYAYTKTAYRYFTVR